MKNRFEFKRTVSFIEHELNAGAFPGVRVALVVILWLALAAIPLFGNGWARMGPGMDSTLSPRNRDQTRRIRKSPVEKNLHCMP